MKKPSEKLQFLTSVNFFLFVVFFTVILFNFFDIPIFKFSRSFDGNVFSFFKNFIDPLSDILDPLNIGILCLLVILASLNIESIFRNPLKLNVLIREKKYKYEEIVNSFKFYSLICKHFLFSLILAGVVCNLLKYIFGVARRKYFFLKNFERIDFFNIDQKTNSFPSGHTQAAFTLAVLIFLYVNRFAFIIFFTAFLMGISRIFMSMHFPSDIFFGAYIGAIFPVLLYNIYFKINLEIIYEKKIINFGDFVKFFFRRFFV